MKNMPRRATAVAAGFAATGLILAGCTTDDVQDVTESGTSAAESIVENLPGDTHEPLTDQSSAVPGADGQPVEISGHILAKYDEVGGDASPLGPATGNQEEIGDGAVTEFEGGIIAWSPDTDAHIVWGEIRVAWEAAGGAGGELGFPISDEHPIEGGLQSDFENGHITYIDGQTEVVQD
ncbi:LGFP repeat-containing protein [Rhodococcus yananensis]|uniref:LGFP repeat-containing protein n=1 Tax=Rhodococcus yananensis TaxID=2879464 RepID=UPI003EBC56AF